MASTPVSDTASILSRTSYASSSSSWSSTSSSSSRSSRATRSSGRGGVGNIKHSSKECLSIAEDAEPDDAVTIATGREAPAAKPTSAHSTGRSGSGNIASSTTVHKASRVASPDQHALTAALVSAQKDMALRYERMLVMASQDEARNGRRSYGRGGAGNSSSPSKPKVSKPPKVVKRSRSLLINYGSLRSSRSSSVDLDATIPEESDDLQTTINLSKRDTGKMRRALSRSFLSLRSSHPAVTTALTATTTSLSPQPTNTVPDLSSPSSSVSVLSSPELTSASVSTPSTSTPSSPLISKPSVKQIFSDSTVDVSVTEVADGDTEAVFFPPDEDGLAYQLLEKLHLRASWKLMSKRETMPALFDDAASISCADLDWMEAEWAERASQGEDEELVDDTEDLVEGEAEEDDFVDMSASKLNLNAVMRALLEEAQET